MESAQGGSTTACTAMGSPPPQRSGPEGGEASRSPHPTPAATSGRNRTRHPVETAFRVRMVPGCCRPSPADQAARPRSMNPGRAPSQRNVRERRHRSSGRGPAITRATAVAQTEAATVAPRTRAENRRRSSSRTKMTPARGASNAVARPALRPRRRSESTARGAIGSDCCPASRSPTRRPDRRPHLNGRSLSPRASPAPIPAAPPTNFTGMISKAGREDPVAQRLPRAGCRSRRYSGQIAGEATAAKSSGRRAAQRRSTAKAHKPHGNQECHGAVPEELPPSEAPPERLLPAARRGRQPARPNHQASAS